MWARVVTADRIQLACDRIGIVDDGPLVDFEDQLVRGQAGLVQNLLHVCAEGEWGVPEAFRGHVHRDAHRASGVGPTLRLLARLRQDPSIDLGGETGLLGDRQEAGGSQQAQPWVPPP